MFDIDGFVAECVEAVQAEGRSGGLAVKEVIERAVADPAALEAALGPPDAAPVFTPWYVSDELTVLHVIWPPGVDLLAHDHRAWAAIGLYGGREDNVFFRTLPDGTLEERPGKTLRRHDTVLLGDDTIHAVSNPSREWTGAIHTYGNDYFAGGKRLWPDPSRPAAAFQVEKVVSVLEAAAVRARAAAG